MLLWHRACAPADGRGVVLEGLWPLAAQFRAQENAMAQIEFFDTFHSCFRRSKVADLSTFRTEERQASTNRQFCCIPGLAEALERGIPEYRRMLQLLLGR